MLQYLLYLLPKRETERIHYDQLVADLRRDRKLQFRLSIQFESIECTIALSETVDIWICSWQDYTRHPLWAEMTTLINLRPPIHSHNPTWKRYDIL